MVGYAARQSTYVDGDVIDAADSNDEFDAILAAFGSTSGHNHDGTGGEGARITVVGTSADNVTFGSALTPDANNTIDIGTSGAQFKDIYIDGTAYLDAIDFNGTAISSTAAELNIVDGGTAATSTTLADADRVVVNDNGTMVQVALTDFETYFESALDTLSNVTTVGALNAGSITSGFGAIDNGSSAITTTGTVTYGSLSDGSITITAFVDEDDMSSNSATLVPTQQSVKAYVDAQDTAQDLDFQGDSGGALSIDLDTETLDIAGGTGIDTVGSSNTLTVNIDNTVATLTKVQTLTNKTLTSPDINGGTVDGATIATSDITVGSGKTLDVSAGTLTLANDQISGDKVEGGTIAATTITTLTFGSITDGSITVTAFVDEDDMSSNSATLVPTQQSVKAYVDTQLTAEDLDITTDSGTIAIDLDSETLTVSGGTGIDSSATGNAVTVAIDSTVATLTGSQTLTNKTLTTPVVNAGLQLKNGSTSAGFLEFFEDSDNGTNKATLIGPASTADVTLTLPSTTGTLATDADITALAIALG